MNKEELRQKLYATGDKKDFVHLHLHSDFSLKDGIGKPTQYAKKAIEIGMSAVAITDHGSIGAHPSFFMYCRSNNLKPIVGVEMYVQNDRRLVGELEKKTETYKEIMKILKHVLKLKKTNKQLIDAHIELFQEMFKQPELTTEDIIEMDFSEVKETTNKELVKVKNEYDEIAKQKDVLKRNRHLVLLAKNETGRKHITKIVSDAARNGFYYKPRTCFDFIKENKEGLIVTSACLAGPINHAILKNENDKEKAEQAAIEVAQMYKDEFGDDFYIEIMLIDIDRQRFVNRILIDVAKKLGIKFVVTNDVHYLDKDGAKAQEISLMLGSKDDGGDQVTMKDKNRMHAIKEILVAVSEKTGDKLEYATIKQVYNDFIELDRFSEFKPTEKNKSAITFDDIFDIVSGTKKFKRVWEFSTKDFWFKDRHQMVDVYIDQDHCSYITEEEVVEGLNASLEIANKIDLWDWDSKEKLPKVETIDGMSSYDYLVELTRQGWQLKAEDSWYNTDAYSRRVKIELGVIRKTEMADYFLIVADYMKHAKQNGCVCGAGRGSACGSLVCYLIDITNIDPLKHDLLFERFLSMSRSVAIYDFSIKDVSTEEKQLEQLEVDDDEFNKWYEEERLIKLEE